MRLEFGITLSFSDSDPDSKYDSIDYFRNPSNAKATNKKLVSNYLSLKLGIPFYEKFVRSRTL